MPIELIEGKIIWVKRNFLLVHPLVVCQIFEKIRLKTVVAKNTPNCYVFSILCNN